MTDVTEVLYLAKSRTARGWEHGSARRSGSHVDVRHSMIGCNDFLADPEQLLAVGWTASIDDGIVRAALKMKVVLSDNTAIDGTLDLCLFDGEYFLRARLDASLSDMSPEFVRILAEIAHQSEAHSKVMRGNIDVSIDWV